MGISDKNWFPSTDGMIISRFETTYALSINAVDQLFNIIQYPSVLEAFFQKTEDWVTGLVYFPIDLVLALPTSKDGAEVLTIGKYKTEITQFAAAVPFKYSMFYMGGINKISNTFDPEKDKPKFLKYEPYTKRNVYLPYYGFINIPMKYFHEYNIGFWLHVDYTSGQAVYYICGYTDDLPSKKSINVFPYLENINNSDPTIIINKVVFQLGSNIPLNNTNASDRVRNLTLAIAKTAGAIALGSASLSVMSSTSGAVSVKQASELAGNVPFQIENPIRNQIGGYVPPDIKVKENITPQNLGSASLTLNVNDYNTIKDSITNTSLQVASVMGINPETYQTQNAYLLNYDTHSIHLFEEQIDFEELPAYISPKPFFDYCQLRDLCGLTEVNTAIIEGFTGTEDEKSELVSLLRSQIILRDFTRKLDFSVYDDELGQITFYTINEGQTFERITIEYNEYFSVDKINNFILYNNKILYHSGIPIKATDYVNNTHYTTEEKIKFKDISFSINFLDGIRVYKAKIPETYNYTFSNFVQAQNAEGNTDFTIDDIGYALYKGINIKSDNTLANRNTIIEDNSVYTCDAYLGDIIEITNTYGLPTIQIPEFAEVSTWDEYINRYPQYLKQVNINGKNIVSANIVFFNVQNSESTPYSLITKYDVIDAELQTINDSVLPVNVYDYGIPGKAKKFYFDNWDEEGYIYIPNSIQTWQDFCNNPYYFRLNSEYDAESGDVYGFCIGSDLGYQDEFMFCLMDRQDAPIQFEGDVYGVDVDGSYNQVYVNDDINKYSEYIVRMR